MSGLTNLQVLHLAYSRREVGYVLRPRIAPGFVLPALLRKLVLGAGVVLDPAVLSSATQLTRLRIVRATIEGSMASAANLLSSLAGLQHIEVLQLDSLEGVVWPASPAAYSALTASTHLKECELAIPSYLTAWEDRPALPLGCWEHVFHPGLVCGSLTSFVVRVWGRYKWGVAAVQSLARCCRVLSELLFLDVLGSAATAALTPLTRLTYLCLDIHSNSHADATQAMQALAALTTLRTLQCTLFFGVGPHDRHVRLSDLLPLTALRQLTGLVSIGLLPGYSIKSKVSLDWMEIWAVGLVRTLLAVCQVGLLQSSLVASQLCCVYDRLTCVLPKHSAHHHAPFLLLLPLLLLLLNPALQADPGQPPDVWQQLSQKCLDDQSE